jgi:ankyrin repeat protein
MKKSLFYLGIALMGFVNAAVANYSTTTHHATAVAKVVGTPLCIAISKGDVETVKKFIEYGANINELSNGLTPLMMAARYNQVEIIEMLIAKGANVKAKDERGNTALKHAENSKAHDAVAYLQEKMSVKK